MLGMVTFDYFYATFWTRMAFTFIQQLWFWVLKCIYLFSLYWERVTMFPTSGSMKLYCDNFILQKNDSYMAIQPLHAPSEQLSVVYVWCYDLLSCQRPLCLGSRSNVFAILLWIPGVSDTWPQSIRIAWHLGCVQQRTHTYRKLVWISSLVALVVFEVIRCHAFSSWLPFVFISSSPSGYLKQTVS